MDKKYSGVIVPMVTPFTKQEQIDAVSVRNIVNHLVGHQAHPFILGTTGESVSVSKAERITLVRTTVESCESKRTVYAGISGSCFSEVVLEAQVFADLGVDVLVATMPSYYPVDEEQMLRYFNQLADQVKLPLVIYNIPATTHLSIPLEVVDKLSHHENIVGFKDSEKGVDRVHEAINRWKDRPDFSYLLGWALMSKDAMLAGADGIVPSTGNFTPGLYHSIYTAGKSGDERTAKIAQDKADIISLLYQKDQILSRSLALLKVLMSAYQLCDPTVLPPLLTANADQVKALTNQVLATFGDLKTINRLENYEQ